MTDVPIPNQGTLVWTFQMEGGDCSVKALPHPCPWLDREKPSFVIYESEHKRPDERAVADDQDVARPIGTIRFKAYEDEGRNGADPPPERTSFEGVERFHIGHRARPWFPFGRSARLYSGG